MEDKETVMSAEADAGCEPDVAEKSEPNSAEEFSFDNLKPKIKPVWKIVFLIILLACIGASLYFSFNALSLDTYEFEEVDGGWQLYGFHNDGTTKEIVIDYVLVKKGIKWEKDYSRPVTSIRKYALCCDNTIKKITVGSSVREIEDQAFYSCKNLRYIDVMEGNESFASAEGVLYNKDKTEIILFPISYVYGDADVTVEEKAGYGPISYAMPDTVKTIRPLCFAYAEKLSSVTLSQNLKELGYMTFFKCEELTTVDLPDGLTSIGSDCFSYCKKLTYIFIPATVTKIEHHVFYECSGLTEIDVAAGEKEFGTVSLGDYWKNITLLDVLKINYGQVRR